MKFRLCPVLSKGVCHMRRNLLLVLATIVLLPPTTASAQGLNGALIGTVRGEQGGALCGARVQGSSPALIGGVFTTTTNDRGQLRFPVLAPGSYTLTVESPPKFALYRAEYIGTAVAGTPVRHHLV